jgi:ABC-2 type transport system ATP-binding protein
MPPAIRCVNLVKHYPGHPPVEAVCGLNLTIHRGECFGLLGPNGAGKSTTIEIIEGLLLPTRGTVEVLGLAWGRHDDRIRRQIGISFQETRLSAKLTVLETVTLFRSFYGAGLKPTEALGRVSLDPKAGARVGTLSGGQRQRLVLACAMVGDPQLLLLDEPTTGLDPQSRHQVWEILGEIRARGATVLLTTHYMEEAENLCDRVAIVNHGRLLAIDCPRQLIADLGGEHFIEFSVAEDGGGPEPERLLDLPAVRAAGRQDGRVWLSVTEPHVALPALLARLEQFDCRLTGLTTRHASLQDVFLKLAGKSLEEVEAGTPTRIPLAPREVGTGARDAEDNTLHPGNPMDHDAGPLAEREEYVPKGKEYVRLAPLVQLTLMWIRESVREPAALFWLYGFPIVVTVAMGMAFPGKLSRSVAVDVAAGPGAEAAAEAIGRQTGFVVAVHDAETCRRRLRTGKSDLLVAATPTVPIHYDYSFLAERPETRHARDTVDGLLQRAAGRRDAVTSTDHELREPGGRYIDFLFPGLLGMAVMQSGLWGVGFLTVDARLRKLIKRLLATPMRKTDFLAAIVLSRLWLILTEVAVLAVVIRVGFGVMNYGRWLDVILLLVGGTILFACLGLVLVSRAGTLETASGLMQLAMFPMWLGSGVFFSTDRLPAAVQPVVQLLPLTPLVTALRAVILEGATLVSQAAQLGILALWTVAAFVLARRWFRWA